MEKMLLKSAAPSSPLVRKLNKTLWSSSFPAARNGRRFVCLSKKAPKPPLPGLIFRPFDAVIKELQLIPTEPHHSLARHGYADPCELAINQQINVEYNVSYAYHTLFAYFDRDNIALKGIAKFFKESSEEEREHAEKLMEYQNKRGGKVTLHSILNTPVEFEHAEKGDALYAMELALGFERLTYQKLLELHAVAAQNNDAQLTDFIESEYLSQQVEAINKVAEYVAQLRRVGKGGHGVWHFDQMLLNLLQ